MVKKFFLLCLVGFLMVGVWCFNGVLQSSSTTQGIDMQAIEKETHSRKGVAYAISSTNPFGRDDSLFILFKENWSDLKGRPYEEKLHANYVFINTGVIASLSPAKIEVTKPTVKLQGIVSRDVKKIFVIAVGNGMMLDRYELKKFVPGTSTTWEYNIDTRYGNILPGKNVYFITAVKNDGTYVLTSPIVVEFEQSLEEQIYDSAKEIIFSNNVKDKTKCLLDVCMRNDKKVTKKDKSLIQKWKQKAAYCFDPNTSCTQADQTEFTITYTSGVSIEIYAQSSRGQGSRISVVKVGNFYVKKVENLGCGGGGRVYQVYNQNGTKTTLEQIGARPFSIGGLTYSPSLSYGIMGPSLPTEEKKISLGQIKTIKDILSYENLQNGKKVAVLYPELIVHINNIPVKYTLVGDFAKNGGSWPDIIKKKRYLVIPAKDYVLSGFVRRYFSLDTNKRVVNTKGEIVLGMDTILDSRNHQSQQTKQVEIVKVRTLDDVFAKFSVDDLYILGVKPGYNADVLAELCKPVVYVYDKTQRQNTLTVHLPQGGYFTHLEPLFSTGTTWLFQVLGSKATSAQSYGSVRVGSKIFPYLYYSVAVPNYTFEQTGVLVYGKDIETFFAYVLPRLCFKHHEQRDFVEYRKTEFRPNVLYFVSFKRNEQLAPWVGLTFGQKPETQTRVLLEAYPVKNMESVTTRRKDAVDRLYPIQKCNRSSVFDVFEWGGVVLQNDRVIFK